MSINKIKPDYPTARYFRIVFSVCVCLVASMMISSLLFGGEGHYTYRAAMPLFALGLLFPFFAIFALLVAGLFYWLDLRAHRSAGISSKRSLLITIVLALGLLTGYANVRIGAVFIFLLLYWLMTGRVAGQAGWSIRDFRRNKWDEKAYPIVMTVLLVLAVASAPWGNFGSELPIVPGTPAFQIKYEHKMNSDIARALRRFPNPQSCLQLGADATRRDDLALMNWDQISTTGEAEVCMFRLLHEWGGVANATSWLEAQGFRVGKNFSSNNPNEERDGKLRVTGTWSIKQNGPRYPTTGVIRRILSAVPYGMGVNATYSANGKELLYLETSFSTL